MIDKEILDSLGIKIESIKKQGKVIIINNKYVIKKLNDDNNFYDYLTNRNFKYFPSSYSSSFNNIEIMDYIKDKNIPKEQRLEDIVYLDSILHLNTTFDKVIDIDKIKEIYEATISHLQELSNYYLDIQNVIEEEVYMSPANYLLIRNISLIYKAINMSRDYLDKWYKEVEKGSSIRYVYIHGNLRESHLLEDNGFYLISWDKSRIDMPIKDIEAFYKNSYFDISLKDIMLIYEQKYPLKKEEKNLLYASLLIPNKIDFNKLEYFKIQDVSNMIIYLEDIINYLKNDSKESNNNTDK